MTGCSTASGSLPGAERPVQRRKCRPRLHTAAHEAERQDHEDQTFLQVTGPYLRFWRVGL
jgi:hypothetical protein